MKRYHNYIIFEGTNYPDRDIVDDLVKFAYMKNNHLSASAMSNVVYDPFPQLCEKCDRREIVYIVSVGALTKEHDYGNYQCGCFTDEDGKKWQYLAIHIDVIGKLSPDYAYMLNYRNWPFEDEIRAITAETENGETVVIKTIGNGKVEKSRSKKKNDEVISW